MRFISLVKQPRILATLLLGFSSGLPLLLTNSTLQAWFTTAGVSLIAIGALSLVGLPYVWKFLWAPFLDRFVPPFADRRRSWIVLMQIALAMSLLVLAYLNPQNQAGLMGFVAVFIAFFSATQDIAIDAYRTDLLHPEERGLGAASYVFAYRIAMLVANGIALVLADYYGWRMTYIVMAGLMAISIIVTLNAPALKNNQPPKSFKDAVVHPFRDLWQRNNIVVMLMFVLLYKLGDALGTALLTPFLIKGLGFSLSSIGLAYKTTGLIFIVLGGFVGGVLLTSMSLYRALFLFGLAQAFSILSLILFAIVGKNMVMMVSVVALENFCSGMSTTAFVALLMTLCHAEYSATQFACLSALASVGRVVLGPFAAMIVKQWGWIDLFVLAFILSFPALILINFIGKNRVMTHESLVTQSD